MEEGAELFGQAAALYEAAGMAAHAEVARWRRDELEQSELTGTA